MKNTQFSKWTILLIILAVVVYFIQPVYTWFAADDFCLMAKIQAEGLIRNMFHDYMNWDGRSISLTYPVCRIGLYAGLPWLGPFLGSLLMMAMAVLLLRIVDSKFNFGWTGIFRTITLTVLLWLVFFNFLSQTLFWTTGVGYNMDIVLLLLALFWIKQWKGSTRDFVLGLPIFFYAGTCSPNGVLALLFLLFVQWMHELYIQKIRSNPKYLYAVSFIFVALFLVIFSPGNKNRMSSWDWKNLTHIWTIYFNFKLLLKNLFNYNSLFIWPLIAIGFMGGLMKGFANNSDDKGWFKQIFNGIYLHRFFLAAVIGFFFFLPLPGLNSPRTAIQFAIFATLYGLSNLAVIVNYFGEKKNQLLHNVALLVNFIFIITAMSQAFDARYVKNQMAQRHSKLKSLQGQNVVLTEQDFVRTPATRRFEDLSSDSAYWLNRCVADHYHLKSIKMVDTRPKKVVMGVITD